VVLEVNWGRGRRGKFAMAVGGGRAAMAMDLMMTAMVLRRKIYAKTLVGSRNSRCDGRGHSELHNPKSFTSFFFLPEILWDVPAR
jgi:hypothetical protein